MYQLFDITVGSPMKSLAEPLSELPLPRANQSDFPLHTVEVGCDFQPVKFTPGEVLYDPATRKNFSTSDELEAYVLAIGSELETGCGVELIFDDSSTPLFLLSERPERIDLPIRVSSIEMSLVITFA
jgi:hypothetical protein